MSSLPLNLKESMALKGFAITLVMIHHFEQSPIAFESLLFFKACGAIACSIFFFVSGYGLVISSKNKTLSYWSARFLKVSLPFFFANIIYVIAYRQPFFSFADYVLYIMGVKLINPHCWFIHALLCMYIAYAVGEALKWKLGGGDYSTNCWCFLFFVDTFCWLDFLVSFPLWSCDSAYY